mmetsp:Transcript_136455/g.323167  ORF Transcript_136455/g.323167 Transcript_136455/m.323167 type:complete len:252 (+) Transcript_136455:1373-2128(+)
MSLARLLLFEAHTLIHKLLLQALEHADHAAGLEFIRLGLFGCRVPGLDLLHHQAGLGGIGAMVAQVLVNAVGSSAGEQLHAASAGELDKSRLLILRLQALHGPANGIDGFRVVLQSRPKVGALFLTDCRGIGLLAAGGLDVGHVAGNLSAETICIGRCRLDVSFQGLQLVAGVIDGFLLLGQGHLTELRELRVLNLLRLHLFHPFLFHIFEHLNDFLGRCDIRRQHGRDHSCQQYAALHCAKAGSGRATTH